MMLSIIFVNILLVRLHNPICQEFHTASHPGTGCWIVWEEKNGKPLEFWWLIADLLLISADLWWFNGGFMVIYGGLMVIYADLLLIYSRHAGKNWWFIQRIIRDSWFNVKILRNIYEHVNMMRWSLISFHVKFLSF